MSVFGGTDGSTVFSTVFFLIAVGAIVVTLNTVLLGGHISFFHSVCVLGYCLLPMTLAGLGVCLLGFLWWPLRAIIVGCGVAWASWCASGFMSAVVDDTKKRLAAYPVFLFYIFLGWLILLI
jgi:hypothetical protein